MGSAARRLIVALDSSDLKEALQVARQLRGLVRYVKIGSILFTAAGPTAIQRIREIGFEVFLDLKFYDIPSTVEHSCRAAVRHQVAMLSVHASGQREMLEAAVGGVTLEAKRLGARRPYVIGVTVLTSVRLSRSRSLTDRIVRLSAQAKRAGLDGVVASAHEVAAIRRKVEKPFLIICPGIRLPDSQASDQMRVASPYEAVAKGADFLVVGRPVTTAQDPRSVLRRILAEIELAENK